MMKRNWLSVLFLAMGCLAAATPLADAPAPDRAKARYYYIEGMLREATGSDIQAHEFFKRAVLADSTYSEALYALATTRLMVRNDSLQTPSGMLGSLALMRPFVDAYPDDFNENQFYAYAARQLGDPKESVRVFERIATRLPAKTTALLQLGDAYMADDNPEAAVDALSRFEAIEGASPQLAMRKLGYMATAGDTVGVLAEADRLIRENPKDPVYRILKGDVLRVIGRTDSVEKYYLEAEKVNPEYGAAKLSLANLYLERGDSAAYDAKIYEALISEDFGMEDKRDLLAEYLQTLISQKNDTRRGDTLFKVLREQYPHEPTVINLEARYSAAKGDFDYAAELMGYVTDLEPDKEQNWGQLMSYFSAGKHFDEADKAYRKALDHITPTRDLRMLHAMVLALDKRYDDAQEAYAEVVRLIAPGAPVTEPVTDPALKNLDYNSLMALSDIYTAIGDMWYQAGDLQKTFGAYDNALFFNPINAMTLNNYAYFLAENDGDLEKARTMSRKAVDLEGANDTFLDTYAWVLFRQGDYKEARNYQQKAVEIAEQNGEPGAELYSHYGDILFMDKEPDKALEYWSKALELDPDNELLQRKVKQKTFFYE